MDVVIVSDTRPCILPMLPEEQGYWFAEWEGNHPDARYFYRIDNRLERPDPASGYQPLGVHGPSQVVRHWMYPWKDSGWRGLALADLVIYELHVGTFTPEGTLSAIIPRLEALKDLGITAVELMPVATFPGEYNWGYDGVYPFAVQHGYGGPLGLKQLVNACHQAGLAVILDVVYNHLGPEGNYLRDFGPYFTAKYQTPWGEALNYDGPWSGEVRNYFIENALGWFENYHVDALRLDAIDRIFDQSAHPFLEELAERVREYSRENRQERILIVENDLNDPRVIRPRGQGGLGLDAAWCDDYHHALHSLATGERNGYYADFGGLEPLARSLREGYVYGNRYSAYRKRRHGGNSQDRSAGQFVVFSQNHDQVGNRMLGERLSRLVSFETLKLAAAAVLWSPFVPLLFMGEEFGEESPFLYFIDHGDPELVEAVRRGRRAEFREFQWQGWPPDPADASTFLRSKLHWQERKIGRHQVLLRFYQQLIRQRKTCPPLRDLDNRRLEVKVFEREQRLELRRWSEGQDAAIYFNFADNLEDCPAVLPEGLWHKLWASGERAWGGPGPLLPPTLRDGEEIRLPPRSVCLYVKSL